MGKKTKSASSEVERVFKELEARTDREAPGVMDVLRVYGNYEATVRQVEQYFSRAAPRIVTRNSTG